MGYDGETRSHVIYGFIGTLLPLATIAVSLRLYSRLRFSFIGVDDLLNFLAYILLIGLVVATFFAIKYGLGRHIADVSPEEGIKMQKSGFSSQVLYPPALGLVKISIVLFLVRILPVVHSWRTPLRCFALFIAAEETALTVGLFLQCRPLRYYWDKSVEGGACFNQPAFYYADATLNMATDIAILSCPYLLFRKLNVPRKQRHAVIALCSAGVFTLVASVVRLPYLHNLNQPDSDPTWDVVDIVIWSMAELASAIILSSVPTIKPLYVRIVARFSDKTAVENSQDTFGSGNISKPRSFPLTSPRISEGERRTSYIHLGQLADSQSHLRDSDHFTLDGRGADGPGRSASRAGETDTDGEYDSPVRIPITPKAFGTTGSGQE